MFPATSGLAGQLSGDAADLLAQLVREIERGPLAQGEGQNVFIGDEDADGGED
ncbi:hypothetical protein [Streptomyces sp. NPDC037389]|uniref:hypothetical protein n=1 Tax=Streptomyces sp. NPDC037389 TaxID=3155369 RepID=UPI0033C3A271